MTLGFSSERVVFVHGAGRSGAEAWPMQHALAGKFDCLFVRRIGFDPALPPVETDFQGDIEIIVESLRHGGAPGGHVVAHSYGAVAALMTVLQYPELVRSLTLCEPAAFSLTREMPATSAHISLMTPLFERREVMSDEAFFNEFTSLNSSSLGTGRPAKPVDMGAASGRRAAAQMRKQLPPWEAPLTLVPGVPTLVLTGGWEPLYEEVAQYLAETGALHKIVGGGHRPQDTPAGQALISEFLMPGEQRAAS